MSRPCGECHQPSSLICGGCKIMNYCCREHQKQHWKKVHKLECKTLFRIEKNNILGRHLIATRDIKAGELILQESPLVVGPKGITLPVCLGCHKPCDSESYLECEGCGFPMCSVKCQVSDSHFDECRVMVEQKYRANVPRGEKSLAYVWLVPLRCVLMKNKSPERYRKIMDLESHFADKVYGPWFTLYKKNIAQFLRERLMLNELDEKTILTIACILDTNAFEVGDKTKKLRGLYSIASMMAHDCTPNTKHSFHGSEYAIVVTATSDIPADGVISTTYTQTFWGTMDRRNHLKLTKCFDCICKRCSDPTELGTFIGATRCMECIAQNNYTKEPYIISTDPLNNDASWQCENCQRLVPSEQIKSENKRLNEEILRMDKNKAENLESFIRKYNMYESGILHFSNSHVVQVKYALVQIYGNKDGYLYSELSNELVARKITYCHDLLDLVNKLEPGYSRIRGQLLYELQAAVVIQVKRQFSENKITKETAQKRLADSSVMLSEAIKILEAEPGEDCLQRELLLA